MSTEIKKVNPLYKRMNETRTQGFWSYDDESKSIRNISNGFDGHIGNMATTSDNMYTTLAVNNFNAIATSLLSTLDLIERLCASKDIDPNKYPEVREAKEAIKLIS